MEKWKKITHRAATGGSPPVLRLKIKERLRLRLRLRKSSAAVERCCSVAVGGKRGLRTEVRGWRIEVSGKN